VLIHRTQYDSLIQVSLDIDEKRVTEVLADGLIISTPTGSTAYSVSAGGSLVSPSVPCICITPICPHTLSFRPVIVPDSSIITISVPTWARADPLVSFDGKNQYRLARGEKVVISKSQFPMPTFKLHHGEWFDGLTHKFHWNKRDSQQPLAGRSTPE